MRDKKILAAIEAMRELVQTERLPYETFIKLVHAILFYVDALDDPLDVAKHAYQDAYLQFEG